MNDTLIQKSYHRNMLNHTKQICSSNKIFYNKFKNIKRTLINTRFPNYFVDEQIQLMIDDKNKINDKSYVAQNKYNHLICFIVIKTF